MHDRPREAYPAASRSLGLMTHRTRESGRPHDPYTQWLISALFDRRESGSHAHESLPRPVTTAPAAIKPAYRRGRHGSTSPGLSFGLTPVRHRSPVAAPVVFGQARTLADAGERWCAVLESVRRRKPSAGSNPTSTATDLRRCEPPCMLGGGGHPGGLSFGPQMVSVDRAEMLAAGWIGPELRPCNAGDVTREEIPGSPYRCR